MNRNYHRTTTKYNGYFNGNESLKNGIRNLKENYKDDFSKLIPVFKMGDLTKGQTIHPYMNKAIEKGSIAIQTHSMNIKGREYNKWIDDNYFMIGKAYFYKGEFDKVDNNLRSIIEIIPLDHPIYNDVLNILSIISEDLFSNNDLPSATLTLNFFTYGSNNVTASGYIGVANHSIPTSLE